MSLHEARLRASARTHLRRSEPVMAGLVERYGDLWPRRPRSHLQALVGLVIDQQISVHAAAAIRGRLGARLEQHWSIEALAALSDEDLLRCGLSTAKRQCLRTIVAASADGRMRWRSLATLPDAELLRHLTQLRGIGPWTAQMFQLFALGRPDVLAPGDLGLQNAARALYGLRSRPDARRLTQLARPWAPYRSLASVYLWASLEKGNWRPRPLPPTS